MDALLGKYNRPGPRYTSYPTAVEFDERVGKKRYGEALRGAAKRNNEPWSVYVHIPFCEKRCTFCACAVISTPQHDRVAPAYVKALLQELALTRALTRGRDQVAQLHLGGGTPTYLAPGLLDELLGELFDQFEVLEGAELSAEVDPRVTTEAHLDVLARYGFNRLSMGVQDLDAKVQGAIGRHQSLHETHRLMEQAQARGLENFNVDLIYGLPYQTEEGLRRTVRAMIDAGVGRAAVYGYAHVPWMRGHQKRLPIAALPKGRRRLRLAEVVREAFEYAGYRAIGLDHFALPDDELALAADDGRLMRNFMGYTVSGGSDLLGLGLSSIGDVDGHYVQNSTKLVRYLDACEAGQFATTRGRSRTRDDDIRRAVIDGWMCHGEVLRSQISEAFDMNFNAYFESELQVLSELIEDGIVIDDGERLILHPEAGPFVRNVAMVFDAYMDETRGRFSKTV